MNMVKYMSLLTGECVDTHREAMELYRAGHDIAILTLEPDYSWKKVASWEH